MPKVTKCPTHQVDFQLLDRAMRCPVNGCQHFVDIEPESELESAPEPKAAKEPKERREEGRAERDEQLEGEKLEKKAKKKK